MNDAGQEGETDADRIRTMIDILGLSQRALATELQMSSSKVRMYCSGYEVPRWFMLALQKLVDLETEEEGT